MRCSARYWCFRKWWYPQIIHFNRVFHYKPSILGYPYFWKHPFCVTTKVLMCSVIRHSVSAFWRPSWYMCLKWNAGESSKVPFVTFCWLQELTWHATYATHVWGVSKNRGTPKWTLYNGTPYEQMDDLGGKPTIFGNIRIVLQLNRKWKMSSHRFKTPPPRSRLLRGHSSLHE